MQKLVKAYKRFAGTFGTKLPAGVQEFDTFATSIFTTYDIPDLPSYRHAIATMIMHLPPTVAHASKKYFAVSVQKAQSNQVAYEVIQSLKAEEKKAMEADRVLDAPQA